ncbi:ATP-binding protein [Streptomyces sp. NPDC018057]|uniref:ATP-binding protein n=1 Tax=unclassified Streptomyces TaxID=2593676 RepID=UPI00379F021F
MLEVATRTPVAPSVPTSSGVASRSPSRDIRIGSLVMVETGTGTLPAYTETLPRTSVSVSRARRLVVLALNVWGMDEDLRDSAQLVISELLTNAVQHARRDSVRVTVTRLGDQRVRVSVVDLCRKRPQRRAARANEEGGRGLEIVDFLSGGKWGVDPMPWGKHVWVDLGAGEEPPGE